MTDKKQDAHAELMDLADWHAEDRVRAGQSPKTYISREALSDFARALTDRITELEAQLEAVGAGGVEALISNAERKSAATLEPFGYFKAEPFGWTDCAETDEGAIALYEAPPPPAQAQDAWQPIATAPNDGTEILLRSAKGRIANGLWSAASERSGFWAWAYVHQEPVEWMPLPSAQAQTILAAAPQPPVAQPSPAAVERKPLTHEQVLALIEAEGNAPEHRTMYDFARAIERAHGIDGIKAHQGGAA